MAGPVSTSCLDLVSMRTRRLGSTSHYLHPAGPEDQVGLGCTGQVFNALCIIIQHKEQKCNVLVHLVLCPLLYSPPPAMSFP